MGFEVLTRRRFGGNAPAEIRFGAILTWKLESGQSISW